MHLWSTGVSRDLPVTQAQRVTNLMQASWWAESRQRQWNGSPSPEAAVERPTGTPGGSDTTLCTSSVVVHSVPSLSNHSNVSSASPPRSSSVTPLERPDRPVVPLCSETGIIQTDE